MLPRVLPVEDDEISALLERSFTKAGIKVMTGAKVVEPETTKKGVQVTLEGKDGKPGESLEGEILLVAIGVAPVLPAGLKLELDRGYIKTDARYQTNVPERVRRRRHHWAALARPRRHVGGDPMPSRASTRGTRRRRLRRSRAAPIASRRSPASGSPSARRRKRGSNTRWASSRSSASGKALAVGDSEGFVKLILGEPHGEILGAHIIGNEATEMIAEMGLAMNLEATHEEIEATIHAHPTLSEAIHEAVGAAYGLAIHI